MEMHDNERQVLKAEGKVTQRKVLMAFMALGVVLICGTMLYRHTHPGVLDPDIFDILRNGGIAIVLACILGHVIIRRRINRTPGLKALIDDEHAALTRYRMFFYGYFVLMAGIIACTLLNVTGVFDTKTLLLVLLTVGGVTPPVLFIITR